VFTTLSKEDQEKVLKELRDKEPDYQNEQLIQALERALNEVYNKINAAYFSSIVNNYSPNSLGQKKPSEEEKKTIHTEFKKAGANYEFLRKRWMLITLSYLWIREFRPFDVKFIKSFFGLPESVSSRWYNKVNLC